MKTALYYNIIEKKRKDFRQPEIITHHIHQEIFAKITWFGKFILSCHAGKIFLIC